MSDEGPPPTPSKRLRAKALEEQGIEQGIEFDSALPCMRCFHAALTAASAIIATSQESPIDVPTFSCKSPYINSKKCISCEKNSCIRIPVMMNGNFLDIISIFKAIDKMLKEGAGRFRDAHKLGIVKALIKLGQRFEVLVNNHMGAHKLLLPATLAAPYKDAYNSKVIDLVARSSENVLDKGKNGLLRLDINLPEMQLYNEACRFFLGELDHFLKEANISDESRQRIIGKLPLKKTEVPDLNLSLGPAV
ncbi:uncharacterized protein FFMR_09281 [Fusarium fujikuroi]|nr:uncharacterized protein FFMR_09281 [Fusarium fujikuroi]SCV35061.1 uncharacterized protein FFFS_04571 [Fusarium fujikuroi]